MRSEGNFPKNGEPTVGFSFTSAPTHRSVLVKHFSVKDIVTTLEHPHTLMTSLQLIFTRSLGLYRHLRDSAFVMLLTSLRMWWKSRKGFHSMASRNVSNTFTVAGRSVQLHKGNILKEMWLKWLYCFVFLRNKVIPWTFWSCHVPHNSLVLKHTNMKFWSGNNTVIIDFIGVWKNALLIEAYNCVYKMWSEKMARGPVFTFPLFWWYAMECWIYTRKCLCGVNYWNEFYCHLFTSSWRYRKLHI